jgi:apolipoprotein N-acyltransferase
MYAKLQTHWYILPVLSGALLIASFHPFNIWPLAFVALVPLCYYVAAFPHPRLSRVFWAGFLTASIFSFSLSYFTLIQFHWLPEAYLFTTAVKLSVIPITLLSGALVGALYVIGYRFLRSSSIILNILLLASVYTAAELLLRASFGGYYFAFLAYAGAPVTPLLAVASIGGASSVSFLIALVNALIGEGLVEWRSRRAAYIRTAAGCVCVLFALVAGAEFLKAQSSPEGVLRVALIQVEARDAAAFGAQKEGRFYFPELEALIRKAVAGRPNLIVYPFSPVEGVLYREEQPPAFNRRVLVASEAAVGQWFAAQAGTATVMTWNTLYAEGEFRNVYEFWKEGSVVAEYRKRNLFPFMDYTPLWAQRLGFYSTPFDVASGAPDAPVEVEGVRMGNLLCSELHDASLGVRDAREGRVLLAVGSEAMFIDAVASNFALRAAQYRAAETGVPVVRGNLLGPSGVIDASGRILASLPAGKGGVLQGEVTYREPNPTVYSRFGEWPLRLLMCVILFGAWISRSRSTANISLSKP